MERQSAAERVEALGAVDALVASLEQSARRAEARTGLTNPELFVLHELHRDDGVPLSVRTLAMRARTGRGRVAPVIDVLTARGLVEEVNGVGGRSRAFLLTPAGRRLVERSPHGPTADLIAALSTLPVHELGELSRGLHALARAMGVHATRARLLFSEGAEPVSVDRRRRVAVR